MRIKKIKNIYRVLIFITSILVSLIIYSCICFSIFMVVLTFIFCSCADRFSLCWDGIINQGWVKRLTSKLSSVAQANMLRYDARVAID